MQNIVLTLTLIGLMATILFHVFLKENLLEDLESHKGNIEEARRLFDGSQSSRTSLVATTILLRVAMLYVASRLFITLATVYLPLYIEETDIDGKEALATVPLVSYVSSFVAALLLKYINKSCGTKVCISNKSVLVVDIHVSRMYRECFIFSHYISIFHFLLRYVTFWAR